MINPGKYIQYILPLILLFSIDFSFCDGFNSISSVNGATMWIVGPNGGIYRSVDGGQTIVNHSFGTVNYNDVFSRLLYLWIVGDGGTLLLSTNVGASFTQYNIANGENIKSVFFIDDNTGWIACDNGGIFKTTNGGINWNVQNSSVNSNLYCIKFIDASTGIACGNNGTLVVSTNGGLNWDLSPIPVSKDLLSADISENTIIASCTDAIVLKSTNLGSSWSIIDYRIAVKSDVTSIQMINANKYYSCGIGGFIRLSTDGGNTFEFQNNPAWVDLNKLYFYDSTRGWALSKDTKIVLRTTNGGNTWLMPGGTVQSLSWVMKVPLAYYTSSGNDFYQSRWNKKEIFITKSNTVMRSLDIGETWSQVGTAMPYGSVSNSFFVSPKDTNVFLVAIDSIDQVTR